MSFFNVIGGYCLQNNLISIRVNNYSNSYTLQILTISETELTVKKKLTDHQHLMKLFEEITNIANCKTCNNSNNWGVSSSCDLPLEPKAIFCKNNTAVLKY